MKKLPPEEVIPEPPKGNSKCKYKIVAKTYGTRRKIGEIEEEDNIESEKAVAVQERKLSKQ